jgi:phosphatidylglycerophosphatase A
LPPVVVAVVLAWVAPYAIAPTMLAIVVLASIACIALTPWAEAYFQVEDPGQEVIDEVAGMALAIGLSPLLFVEAGFSTLWIMASIGSAFVLFRVFDILKPPPIYQLQSLPKGWGVLLDDLLAGLVAAGCTWAITEGVGRLCSISTPY